jgi:hypothetical protein
MVFMTDSSDHVSGKTGLTLAITASKAGAAFGSISPSVTERGSGWYSVSLTYDHTDTLGDLVLHITATGADPTDVIFQVVTQDPEDLGQYIADDVWDEVLGTGTHDAANSAGRRLRLLSGMVVDTGTASAGGPSSITLTGAATADYYNGSLVVVIGGTGIGQVRLITDYTVGKVATVDRAWATEPDATSIYIVIPCFDAAELVLLRDLSTVGTPASRSLLNAIRKLMNKVAISGSTLTVYEEDDSTAAYTQTIATDSGQLPIQSLDTT